jgi:hypothetical protein
MWPRCGPSGPELGRRVPALHGGEILHRWRSLASLLADRGCPCRTVGDLATGTRRARPARTNSPRAPQRWPPRELKGEAVLSDRLARWQAAKAARQPAFTLGHEVLRNWLGWYSAFLRRWIERAFGRSRSIAWWLSRTSYQFRPRSSCLWTRLMAREGDILSHVFSEIDSIKICEYVYASSVTHSNIKNSI